MTPIRPSGLPPAAVPAPPQRTDEGKLAAQRAFFAAAMGQPQGAAAAAPASPVAAAPQAARTAAEPAAEAPPRILRPGTLLDIRV